MFIHCASDHIMLYTSWGEKYEIPFRNVEKILVEKLIFLYRTIQPTQVYILTWPGSFTNVRVGALVCNTLAFVHPQIQMLMIDKISVYRYAYHQDFLPQQCCLFIGQRKNIRYYNFEDQTREIYSKQSIPDLLESKKWNFCIDQFVGEDFSGCWWKYDYKMIEWWYAESQWIFLQFEDKKLSITSCFYPTEKIEPYYAMEPNIGS